MVIARHHSNPNLITADMGGTSFDVVVISEARAEFARVHEHWDAYNALMFARSKLRDLTRLSTYVISILHHVQDGEPA